MSEVRRVLDNESGRHETIAVIDMLKLKTIVENKWECTNVALMYHQLTQKTGTRGGMGCTANVHGGDDANVLSQRRTFPLKQALVHRPSRWDRLGNILAKTQASLGILHGDNIVGIGLSGVV